METITLTATIKFTVQDRTDADDENRQHRSPEKKFELMDSDNFREAFVESVDEAKIIVHDAIVDAFGLSGGIALGSVDIKVG